MNKLYMDVHIPDAITRHLRQSGVDVLKAQEDGTAEIEDSDLLDRATELGRLLVTYDKHFIPEAAKRQTDGVVFTGIIFAPQEITLTGRYMEDLELIALAARDNEYDDQLIYLPLK